MSKITYKLQFENDILWVDISSKNAGREILGLYQDSIKAHPNVSFRVIRTEVQTIETVMYTYSGTHIWPPITGKLYWVEETS